MSRAFLVSFFVVAALACACSQPEVDRPAVSGGKADDPAPGEEIRVRSVWAEKSASPGKQHFAILEVDLYTAEPQLLLFGEQDRNLSVRSFVADAGLPDWGGHTRTVRDDSFELTVTFVTGDLATVTLIGNDGSHFDLAYERVENDDAIVDQAVAAARTFYAQYDLLLERGVESLDDLKAIVQLHDRSHSMWDNWRAALPWQFQFEWLEALAETYLSGPNPDLAGVVIEQDGSDAISRYFEELFGQGWTDPIAIPSPQEALEDWDWTSDEPAPVFYTFRPGISGLIPGPMQDGLEQFAGFTVQAMHAFVCDDVYRYVHERYWVLADGSVLSHRLYAECD